MMTVDTERGGHYEQERFRNGHTSRTGARESRSKVAGKGSAGDPSSGDGSDHAGREAEELPRRRGPEEVTPPSSRTPLFQAIHSERYARQALCRRYADITGADIIIVIDQVFPENLTYLEELLFDCDPARPLHVLLASPGGDGETAIRMVRSMQSRCSELTMILPDMAKSAATLMCLGADHIIMGPAGDLGPVDPQFQLGGRNLVSAKEIVAAVDEAEERINKNADTFPLFAGLLADVNMLMVEQARSALNRTGALVREAIACNESYTSGQAEELATRLQAPLIDDPHSHSAVISGHAAKGFGLPVIEADPSSEQWGLIWSLWTRYFTLGCFPVGPVAVYEGRRASHILPPS